MLPPFSLLPHILQLVLYRQQLCLQCLILTSQTLHFSWFMELEALIACSFHSVCKASGIEIILWYISERQVVMMFHQILRRRKFCFRFFKGRHTLVITMLRWTGRCAQIWVVLLQLCIEQMGNVVHSSTDPLTLLSELRFIYSVI